MSLLFAATATATATATQAQPVVVADFWSIRNNWAMTSDDVYVGTVAGCYEGLARVNYDGKLSRGSPPPSAMSSRTSGRSR
jgi:peptide/nickel transport system substrate-binding protein